MRISSRAGPRASPRYPMRSVKKEPRSLVVSVARNHP